ncbi:MAG: hypothetical protein Q9215_003774 [Flavoplaca cf. flavocitrina]
MSSNRYSVSGNRYPASNNGNPNSGSLNSVPINRNAVPSSSHSVVNYRMPVPADRNSVPAHHPSRKIESLSAGTLFQLYCLDHQRSSTNPVPLTSSQIDTQGRLCLSYVFQVSARLSREHFTRFVDVLKAYRQPNSFEITRHELSTIFDLANEYQLWEECLELVFPNWLKAMEGREQARLRRMQRQGQGLPV